MSSLSTQRRNLNDDRAMDTTANEESSNDEGSVSDGSSPDENVNPRRPTVTTQKRKLTTDEEIANKYSNAMEDEPTKKTRRVLVTPLSSTQLLTGLTKLFHSDFPTLSQKGQEPAYIARVMQAYQAICYDMAPNMSFLDTISKIDSLGGKKEVKLYLQHMREEQRNQVLDKLIGSIARERILQDTTRITSNNVTNDDPPSTIHEESNDNETDNAAMDASPPNSLPKVHSSPVNDDDDEENEADFDDLKTSPTTSKDAQSNKDQETKEVDLEDTSIESNNLTTAHVVQATTTTNSPFDSDEEEKEAEFNEEETAPTIHSFLEKENEVADLETINDLPPSKAVELDEAVRAKVHSHSDNDDEMGDEEKEAHLKEAETAPDVQVHSDWNKDEEADRDNGDKVEATIENDAATSQIDQMEDNKMEDTEAFMGGIVDRMEDDRMEDTRESGIVEEADSEALVFDVSQEQIYLAQTQQTKQSESDVFLFSSEEFPTQLFYGSSQFNPEFLSTPKDTPTQLADSTNEDDSETPTQLANSQYFMTQN